ncbi:MAG: hypothetical protein DLM59_14280 [Pseudonocardiales bacterium]|nr:MAG: hypothetical protein DLM59_14280 [Pseudonocardiales bacterium]
MTSTKGSAPSSKKPTGKVTGRPPAKSGSGGKPGSRPAGKGGARPRGKAAVAPIKPGLPWGLIAIGVAIAMFAVAVIGYAVYQVDQSKKPPAARISDISDFHKTKYGRDHVTTHVKYAQSPPVGGNHNGIWQNCMGDVYPAQIANEHAVHSLEHGAVWITYRPGLAKSEIDKLASKVKGKPYMLMSPYPGLSSPISLQAWGYQLKVKSASDKRINTFIDALSNKGAPEPGGNCANGVTKTGTDIKTQAG